MTLTCPFENGSHKEFSIESLLESCVVKCLTHNPGVLGLSRTGSSWFFMGVSLGKALEAPT